MELCRSLIFSKILTLVTPLNITLLSIIQSERERRNAPAVLASNKEKGRHSVYDKQGLGKIWIVLRGVKDTFNMISRLDSMKETAIMLPGNNHKYVEVEEELIEAGIKPGQISIIGEQPASIWTKLLTLFLIASRFNVIVSLFRVEHAFKYFEILFLYSVLCKRLQKKEQNSRWIIVGDLTSSLIGLSAACKQAGQTVVYWQYSFLDFKHMPVHADTAIILNNTGIELSKVLADNGYYWRNIGTIKEVQTEHLSEGPVGVLLNVLAHEKAWDTIVELQKNIGLPFIVRFHPNSKLVVPKLPKEITISDKNESLDSFAERISLAVCGNTQAQAKLIMMGVPVLQLEGLDLLEFDFHGYIERNIVPGIRKPDQYNPDQIVSFYNSEKYKTGLFNLIGPTGENRKPGLEIFEESLMNSDS